MQLVLRQIVYCISHVLVFLQGVWRTRNVTPRMWGWCFVRACVQGFLTRRLSVTSTTCGLCMRASIFDTTVEGLKIVHTSTTYGCYIDRACVAGFLTRWLYDLKKSLIEPMIKPSVSFFVDVSQFDWMKLPPALLIPIFWCRSSFLPSFFFILFSLSYFNSS